MAFALFLLVPFPPFVADQDAGDKERNESLDCDGVDADAAAATLTIDKGETMQMPVPSCLTGWTSLLSLPRARMIPMFLLTLHRTRRFVSPTIVLTPPLSRRCRLSS